MDWMRKLVQDKIKREDKSGAKILLGALLFIALIFALFGNKGYFEYRALNQQKSQLEKDITTLTNQRAFMQEKLKVLKSGDWLLENMAREKLGMTMKNEKVFEIVFEDEN